MKGKTQTYNPLEKDTHKEHVEWKDSKSGVLTFEKKDMTFDGTKELGYNVNSGDIDITYEILEFNLKQHQIALHNSMKQLSDLDSKLQKADGILKANKLSRFKTSEMVKLQKNILALEQINQIEQLNNQKKPILADIDKKNKFIAMRTKTLESAPKE